MTLPAQSPGACILSIGTATPVGRMSCDHAIQLGIDLAPTQTRASRLESLHRRSGVDSRGVVIVDESGEQWMYEPDSRGCGPRISQRIRPFTEAATQLGTAATTEALRRGGVTADRITHVVTVSCTGFEAPGFDQALIESIAAKSTVRRTHIGFMGCHAAVNALAVAKAFVEADANAVVLVCCVELCSLHYHFSDRIDQLIANAIFADGAAAAIVAAPTKPTTAEREPLSLLACESTMFPNSADAMRWEIGDHGFEMTLAAEVPALLERFIPDWLGVVLDREGLRKTDVGGWAIHPGGPRIVESVSRALHLPEHAGDVSRDVLRRHGNMSSGTILFVLREMWERDTPRPWIGLAFGPGLAGEAMIVR